MEKSVTRGQTATHVIRTSSMALFLLFVCVHVYVCGQAVQSDDKAPNQENTRQQPASTESAEPKSINGLVDRLKTHPDDWHAQNQLAAAYVGTGQFDLALPLLNSAADHAPENASIFYNLAVVYEHL